MPIEDVERANGSTLVFDSVDSLIQNGMNRLASVSLAWSVDTSVVAGVADTIRLSTTTGSPMAVFLRSRLGVTYPSVPVDTNTTPIERTIVRPLRQAG